MLNKKFIISVITVILLYILKIFPGVEMKKDLTKPPKRGHLHVVIVLRGLVRVRTDEIERKAVQNEVQSHLHGFFLQILRFAIFYTADTPTLSVLDTGFWGEGA